MRAGCKDMGRTRLWICFSSFFPLESSIEPLGRDGREIHGRRGGDMAIG